MNMECEARSRHIAPKSMQFKDIVSWTNISLQLFGAHQWRESCAVDYADTSALQCSRVFIYLG